VNLLQDLLLLAPLFGGGELGLQLEHLFLSRLPAPQLRTAFHHGYSSSSSILVTDKLKPVFYPMFATKDGKRAERIYSRPIYAVSARRASKREVRRTINSYPYANLFRTR